jgi:ubiquitin-protein ligase
MQVYAGDNYPQEAPKVQFIEPKIAMPAVGGDGKVVFFFCCMYVCSSFLVFLW